jgi:hypothetical protein
LYVLKRKLSPRSFTENFGASAGEPLLLSEDAAFPKVEFLAEHRFSIFAWRGMSSDSGMA